MEKNLQSLFKKWIVARPKGNCQILFALTELDNFCEEIKFFCQQKEAQQNKKPTEIKKVVTPAPKK